MISMLRMIAGAVVALGACVPLPAAAQAQEIKTVVKKGDFDDVKFELNNAIVSRGFVIEQDGDIGRMLERTGVDVGSAKPVYKQASFLSFCSARLSRQMMEADAANIAFCPYVVFVYEAVGTPGEVVVGYKAPAPRGNEASRAALAEVDKLLDAIVKDAVR